MPTAAMALAVLAVTLTALAAAPSAAADFGVPALGAALEHSFNVSSLSLVGLDDTSIAAAHCVEVASNEWQLRVSILARSGLTWNETQQEPLALALSQAGSSGCVRSTLAQRSGRLLLAYANEGQVFLHSVLPSSNAFTSLFANVTGPPPMLDFETEDTVVLSMLDESSLLACIVSVEEPMQVLACSEGPQATSFQMISMTGLGFFVFYVSASGEVRVSSLLVSRFQVSWLPSSTVLSAPSDGTNSSRRLLWLEKLLVNIGDYGLLFEESVAESTQSVRLAIGHFVDKEPHLDLVKVLETKSRRFAQVPSGALLLGDANGLRFAVREAASVALGPVVSKNVVDLRSVQVLQLYSEAVLVTNQTLQLVADYRCHLPASGHQRYDISNCSGTLEASRCKLACRQDTTVPGEGFAKPQAMCPEEGGIFQLNGCSPPRCFLPAEVPLQFNVSMCTTPDAPLSEEECVLRCRSGLGVARLSHEHGAALVQIADLHEMQLLSSQLEAKRAKLQDEMTVLLGQGGRGGRRGTRPTAVALKPM